VSGPSSGLAALEAGLERARRANKPLVLCAMPGVVWEGSSGLDPALLGALAGEVLLQDARPRLLLPGQAGQAGGAAGAVTPTAAGALQGAGCGCGCACMWSGRGSVCGCLLLLLPALIICSSGRRQASCALAAPAGKAPGAKAPATGTGEKATGRGRPASEFPAAMQQPLLDFLATAKDRSIDKVGRRAMCAGRGRWQAGMVLVHGIMT
jgi:hypothetical protein